ncbi:MAG: 23S rRNA (uracil(1939)-C(5))-methyltransferase RlmD [Bacteroidota bacterium]
MARKKKTIKSVTITGIADKGKAVGRADDGRVVFVQDVVPGDVVDVLVLRKKKGVMQGVPTAFHHYSKERILPLCEHFGVCGGCKWQHFTYSGQIANKEQVVRDAIQRIAKVQAQEFLPILGAESVKDYRNKMEFTFSNKRWLTREELDSDISNIEDVLGFHRAGAFDKIVNIQHCQIQGGAANGIRNGLREIAISQDLDFFDIRQKEGYLRNVVIRNSTIGEVMVLFSFHYEDQMQRERYLEEVLRRFPQITSLYYCINPKVNDFILDLEMVNYYGPGYIEEMLGEVRFRIGPKSFFQTNTRQAVRLFNVVRDFAGLSGEENVYDLYTGIGSIALYLAKSCKQVVGIEEVGLAIEDAKINAQLNEAKNTIFYAGDVKDILTKAFAEQHGRPDVLITDPPRAGMHKEVVSMLLELESPKVVYVSCNPATQARDIQLLNQKYDLLKIQPVDMFPHTHHIESVALLGLRTN